jgi:hypothetical protein
MNRKWAVVGGLVILFIAVTYSFREGNTTPLKNTSTPKNKQIIQDLEKLDNLGYDIRWNDLSLLDITNKLNYRRGLVDTIKELNPELIEITPLLFCMDKIINKTADSLCASRSKPNIQFIQNAYGVREVIDLYGNVTMMILPDNPTIKMVTDAINDLLSFINYLQSTYNLPPTTTLVDAKTKLQQKLDKKM